MRLLLDSHILLRLDREPNLVPIAERDLLADGANEVFVSAATVWELGIKRAKGKLAFVGSVQERLSRYGFVELPVTIRHGEEAAGLDWRHRDPFDRMLVAQARVEGLMLVTVDRAMREYFENCL